MNGRREPKQNTIENCCITNNAMNRQAKQNNTSKKQPSPTNKRRITDCEGKLNCRGLKNKTRSRSSLYIAVVI
jgi:hypothetical protein